MQSEFLLEEARHPLSKDKFFVSAVIAGSLWLFSHCGRTKVSDCKTSDVMKKKKCIAAALKIIDVKYVVCDFRYLGVLYPVHNGLKTGS